MALIICSECNSEYSDKASACPKCGCPTKAAIRDVKPAVSCEMPAMVVPVLKGTKKIAYWIIGGLAVFIVGVVWMGNGKRAEVVVKNTETTVAAPVVVPWATKAEAALGEIFSDGKALRVISEGILKIIHHSGTDAMVTDFSSEKKGDEAVICRLVLQWKGGLSGSEYQTVLIWELGKNLHGSVRVESDNAPVSITAEELGELDKYFETVLYKAVKDTAGE